MANAQRGRKRPSEVVERIAEKLRGRTLSEEHKAKLREKRKGRRPGLGRKQSPEERQKRRETSLRIGNKPPSAKGRKYSDEVRKQMSETRKKLAPLLTKSGPESPNWKGGITPENRLIRGSKEFKEWREAVFARDNWTCQQCENRGVHLHPHHIKEFAKYPELRFEVSNGLTLCVPCHLKLHGLDKKPLVTLRTKGGKVIEVPTYKVERRVKQGCTVLTAQTPMSD
jgi:hypothetical protein